MATFFGLFAVFISSLLALVLATPTSSNSGPHGAQPQHPLSTRNTSLIATPLFFALEELSRIVDIAYCVGTAGLGIQKPFSCASHCADRDFEAFELVESWNTGPFMSDSCGYIALDHNPASPRIIVAFRGTYSVANTIADLSTVPQEYVPYPGDDDDNHFSNSPFLNLRNTFAGVEVLSDDKPPKCTNCTVHTGFHTSWLNTRPLILPHLILARAAHPSYKLVLVGHSLGGAVAALAGLDFVARGWDPHVTTFGEPRVGNMEFNTYIDERFGVDGNNEEEWKFHRVTHVGDPVPLLPLEEWGYTMHGAELFIAQPDLPVSLPDIQYCDGNADPECIAGGDEETRPAWGIPNRFKFWQLFFAHRDYFWRLGLCVPGGDPWDWYRKYPRYGDGEGNVEREDETTEL